MELTDILKALINGLVYGSVYAIIAQGYYITFITTKTLNFGQGDFVMLGSLIGLSTFMTITTLGGGVWIAFIGSLLLVIVILGICGWGLEQVAIRPLKSWHSIGWILSTVAVSMIVRNVAMLIWGRDVLMAHSPFGRAILDLGILKIRYHDIFVLVSAAVIMLLLFVFLKKSLFGKALEAVAFNKDAASLMGINPRLMASIAFIIAGVLAGVGGVLVGPMVHPGAFIGLFLGLKAFAVAIIGGIENPRGIFIGGLLLGVIENLFTLVSTSMKEAAAFFLILVVLAVFPQGLFGKRVKEKF
ncbi:branched-chain amino acid ABC transporter permease [Sporosarcina sp. CAU 1771]